MYQLRGEMQSYVQIKNEELTRFYEFHRISYGNIFGRIELMLKFLDRELSEMPMHKWADFLSIGVSGNYAGLNKLEKLAVSKLEKKK
ncbi:MAG: hypothetical protein ABIH49_00975 [archaeon]